MMKIRNEYSLHGNKCSSGFPNGIHVNGTENYNQKHQPLSLFGWWNIL